jgi:hypothetical protein
MDVELSLGVMTYIPSYIRIDSAIERLIRGYIDTQTAW